MVTQIAAAVQGLSRQLGKVERLPRDIGREYAGIRQVAPDALRALGLTTGLPHMEWFRRPDGSVAVSEVRHPDLAAAALEMARRFAAELHLFAEGT